MASKFTKINCPKCGAPTDKISGGWLREQHNKAGFSLRKLGAKLGYSSPFLSDVENNRRGCSERLRKAYEELGAA